MNIYFNHKNMKLLNSWSYWIGLFVLCWNSGAYAQLQVLKREKTVEVISEYAYWVTSMCEQGCTNIDLGPYKLTTALKGIPQYKRGIVVWAKGDFVLVKDLPTIAGPRANTSMRGQKMVMRKLEVKQHKEIKFVQIFMNNKAKENFANGADFSIDFAFTNPLEKAIKFKITMANKTKKVMLDAQAKKTISMLIPAAKNKAYINYLIVNESFFLRNFSNSLKMAESSGLVIYLNNSIYPPTIAKK